MFLIIRDPAPRLIVSLSIFSQAPLRNELVNFQVNLSSKLIGNIL